MSRRRYVYRQDSDTGEVKAFEVGADYSDAPRSTGDLSKFEYANTTMPDGTFINDRSDYMRYLKRTGTVPSSEFKGEWERAAQQREARARGERSEAESRARREAFGRAAYRKGLLK